MHLEDLVEDVGSLGWFQIIVIALLFGPKMLFAWSMLIMSFAGAAPDWWCVPKPPEEDAVLILNNITKDNTTYQVCSKDSTTKGCIPVYANDMRTVVSEWDLVCDKKWIKPTMTSIQMSGVLIGALVIGQTGDIIGRKKTFFATILLHSVTLIVASFSTSWQMFSAMRFFIGSMIGSYLVVSYVYLMEFIGTRHRPICSSVPAWVIGVCFFAMTANFVSDWSKLHLICGVLHAPFLLGWFFMPESMRWLAVHGKLEEAERVVERMARFNKKAKPKNTAARLKALADEEKKIRESGRKYTFLDVYRGKHMLMTSLICAFVWMCLSLVYYGLSFGVESLSGNLYLNIFLLAVVEIPVVIATYFLNLRFGRRRTSFGFFTLAALAAVAVIVAGYTAPKEDQGPIITVLAIIAKLNIGGAWQAFQVFTGESYPTVIRNLGYGAANTASRVGGIAAPYLFALDTENLYVPYTVVASCMAICGVLSLLMKETNGIPMEDTLEQKEKPTEEISIINLQNRPDKSLKNPSYIP